MAVRLSGIHVGILLSSLTAESYLICVAFAGQQVYRPEYRDPKKRIDRARNHANLQEEVTKPWAPEKGSGPGLFVIITDHMEKVSTRLDGAKKQIQDLFAMTKVRIVFHAFIAFEPLLWYLAT